MSEKRFIVSETFRDYYQIKCEKKDYSRVLAPNTVARLLNEQQADLNYLAKFIGEFKVEKFKLKLRNLRMLEDKVLKQQDLLNEQQELIEELQEENKQLKLTLSEYGVDLKAFEIFKQKIGYYDKVIDDE